MRPLVPFMRRGVGPRLAHLMRWSVRPNVLPFILVASLLVILGVATPPGRLSFLLRSPIVLARELISQTLAPSLNPVAIVVANPPASTPSGNARPAEGSTSPNPKPVPPEDPGRIQEIVDPIVDLVEPIVEPIVGPVEPIVDPVVDSVEETTGPVQDAVDQTTGGSDGGGGTVQDTVNDVTDTVNKIVGP